VDHDALHEPGSELGSGTSTFQQKIISNYSYTHDEQGDNAGQEKEGSMVSSIICDRRCHLEVAASRLLVVPALLKLQGVAGHWLAQ